MAQSLAYDSLIAPQHGSRHAGGSYELCEGLEHLSDESFARPISHGDGAPGTAHSKQLAGHERRPWGKHDPDQAGYDVEAGIFKWERFGVAFPETSVETFRIGARLRTMH